jgi:hypothetical protein
MLTETLSGKCPCCGYDKLIQRYGSLGHLQLDGCANCGFGYSTNHHDGENFGVSAWLPYAKHCIACVESEPQTEDSYQYTLEELNQLPDEEIRRMVFDWCEKQDRYNDVVDTVFVYTEEDVKKHKEFGLPVFKQL